MKRVTRSYSVTRSEVYLEEMGLLDYNDLRGGAFIQAQGMFSGQLES